MEVTEEKATQILSSVIPQNCKDHPNEQISYLCRDHDTMCCNTCIISKHEKCKDKKGTDDIGKSLKMGQQLEELVQWIRKLEQNIKVLEFGLSCSRKELENGKHAILCDIKDRRDQINAVIDELEQNILDEFHSKTEEIELQVAVDTEVLKTTHGESKHLDTILVVNKDMATNTQYLLATRHLEKKRKELEAQVNEVSRRGRVMKFEWSLGPLISNIKTVVKKQKDIIKIETMSFSTACESSTVVIEKENKNSFFVNVEILEDNRILVLDQTQSVLRLLGTNLKQTCQIFIKDVKQMAAVSKDLIVVCLNDCKQLRFFKLSGTKIALGGELRTDLNCFTISKYRNAAILICSNNKKDDACGLYPGEIIFKKLQRDKTLADFNFPKMDNVSPWRGFVFDSHLDRFVAVSTDGMSLIWLAKSGNIIKEKRFDSIGRGGLSGLAVDTQGRVYTAATRKIFEITGAGKLSSTFDANINVYSIAVSANGDILIAVGHNNAIEVFTLSRFD